MKTLLNVSWIAFLLPGYFSSAQDISTNGKALNFPTPKYGISVGNSHEFTGVRMNWADEGVTELNGLNLTGWLKRYKNKQAVVNGISIGGIPTARSMQPINIGLLGVGSAPGNCNGLTLGAGVIGSAGNVNGLSVSGLYTGVDGTDSSISGVSISAGAINVHKTMDGLALGGLAVVSDKDIHGVAATLLYLSCDDALRGVGVCPGYVQCEVYKGVSIAGYATTTKMHGVAVGLYNRAQELHGVQFGLMNYAGNNPKGFRMLPFINLHFGKPYERRED